MGDIFIWGLRGHYHFGATSLDLCNMNYKIIPIDNILELEYQIELHVTWLNNLELISNQEHPVILKQIEKLLLHCIEYTQIIPYNDYRHQIYNLTNHMSLELKEHISNFKKKISDLDTSHRLLTYASQANKVRIETNASMSLIKYFINEPIVPPNSISVWNKTSNALSTLGIYIPVISLGLIAYQLYQKAQLDSINQLEKQPSQELMRLYYEKKYQIYKNFLIILLNLSNVIVNLYRLFNVGFYFSFLSVCVDFLFFLIEYDKKTEQLHQKELQLLQQLPELSTNTSKLETLVDTYQAQPEPQLTIIEYIINQQKQKIERDKFYVEFVSWAIMFVTMIVLQQQFIIQIELMLLTGLLSSYFYNVIKPYIVDFYIEYNNPDTIYLTGPHQEKLQIKLATLHQYGEPSPSKIESHTIFGLSAKILIPCITLFVSGSLSPVFLIGLITSLNITSNLLENELKQNSSENLQVKP